MKKVIVASDSFKGSLSSIEIGNIFKEVDPNTKVLSISDGGEGFVDSIIFNSEKEMKIIYIDSFDDMKNKIIVKVATQDDDAYLDVSSIMALHRYPGVSAFKKTSFGLGVVLKELQENYKNIYIGLGGSSTSDGGFGAALAMGYKFLDINDKEITELSKASHINKVVSPKIKANFIGFSDVESPLLGKNGAVNVYGKQKWLTNREMILQEKYLNDFSKVSTASINIPGTGAAGGIGFFLAGILKAKLRSGIHKIIELSNIANLSKDYDYLITGEGKFDNQSFFGKVPVEIAKISKTSNILIAGVINADKNIIKKYFTKHFQIMQDDETIEDSMANTASRIKEIAKKIINEK